MIEQLEAFDRTIVLWVNGFHQPWLDEFMWIVSARITWVPLYMLLIWLFYRKNNWKSALIFIGFAILTVTLCDQLSNHLFKDLFMRYRPSHHDLLTDKLHFYRLPNGDLYKGGQYGFVSSHAANFFGVCTFAWYVLRKWYRYVFYVLLASAVIVSISRIYLGVHYLTDIIGGALLGILLASIVYIGYLKISEIKKAT